MVGIGHRAEHLVVIPVPRGYNIGVRLIDEFLAKSGVGNCSNFRETADVIAKVSTRVALGETPRTNAQQQNSWGHELDWAFSSIS